MIWITPVLAWGQHAQPGRIQPLDRASPCAGGGDTGGCNDPAAQGESTLDIFLMPLRLTKEAKPSHTNFFYLLAAMSGTKSNSFWVSRKSKTTECPRRGFLEIYVS